ncbi:putative nuclease HARBI1 [Eupeodes corollae]|uniref:putative nuclease HARBI1 n=1 Tax=Eupeodes corollae TaxID=290404 RepID=UPI00248F87D1|nr:putative nuclease HARBI1 [Eupeodes corollae]
MAEYMNIFAPVESTGNYKILYRFTQTQIEALTDYFFQSSDTFRGGRLSNKTRMRVFLRFVADPGFQSGIAEDFGIDQSSVSRIIIEVGEKIVRKKEDWIKFPNTLEQTDAEKVIWLNKYQFPSCIGAIDCTHVRIKKPIRHSDEFVNRKGFHSINVQATCNGAELFTSVDISWPGSVHDSRIFKNSEIYQTLLESSSTILIGDEGYGITPFLMTPYRNPVSAAEVNFNNILTQEKVIIERVFGQLKQKFPCLQYKLRVATRNAPKVIMSCFILHNISKAFQGGDENEENQMDAPMDIEEEEHTPLFPPNDTSRRDSLLRVAGQSKRNEIARLLLNQNR